MTPSDPTIPGPPGDGQAPDSRPRADSDAFFQQVYDELRTIAHARLRGERAGITLQSTELVHEAYMRLRPANTAPWESRAQFFAAAAEAMRRILVDRARARGRRKRGGDADGRAAQKVPLDVAEVAALAADDDPETVLALDDAIAKLARQDERVAEIVRLRFYAGLGVEEVAELLGASPRTVLRDWAFARAWLYGELTNG
ncbi:MAG: ECF-type sigma factor [Candidatus Eisenbacteria bacterium]